MSLNFTRIFQSGLLIYSFFTDLFFIFEKYRHCWVSIHLLFVRLFLLHFWFLCLEILKIITVSAILCKCLLQSILNRLKDSFWIIANILWCQWTINLFSMNCILINMKCNIIRVSMAKLHQDSIIVRFFFI